CSGPWARCSSASRCSTSIVGPGFRPVSAASRGAAPSATRRARCARRKWTRRWHGGSLLWRMSLAYDGERADGPVLERLETILRHVAEELTGWRTRALKAEADLKESGAKGGGGGAGAAKLDLEARGRVADLESENKTLRQRVEAARLRAHALLSRLTDLDEQARDSGGNGGGRAAGGSGTGGSAGVGGGVP